MQTSADADSALAEYLNGLFSLLQTKKIERVVTSLIEAFTVRLSLMPMEMEGIDKAILESFMPNYFRFLLNLLRKIQRLEQAPGNKTMHGVEAKPSVEAKCLPRCIIATYGVCDLIFTDNQGGDDSENSFEKQNIFTDDQLQYDSQCFLEAMFEVLFFQFTQPISPAQVLRIMYGLTVSRTNERLKTSTEIMYQILWKYIELLYTDTDERLKKQKRDNNYIRTKYILGTFRQKDILYRNDIKKLLTEACQLEDWGEMQVFSPDLLEMIIACLPHSLHVPENALSNMGFFKQKDQSSKIEEEMMAQNSSSCGCTIL